ncbi:MAG: recombinase family protein, partial [Dehalococcoidia bacterium]
MTPQAGTGSTSELSALSSWKVTGLHFWPRTTFLVYGLTSMSIAAMSTRRPRFGRSIHRPVFQEMVRLAKRKPLPFEVILVWKLSRFARNREDSILYKALLRKHGVRVISINEPIEDTATGKFFEAIIESMDELYSASLAQEVTRGMREAASRGFLVSARTPFGYRRAKVKDGTKERSKLAPDPDTDWVVRLIFGMAQGGMGVKEIVRELNRRGIQSPRGKRWGRGRVYEILTNEQYTGTLLWGRQGKYHKEMGLEPVRVQNAWPALVDEQAVRDVQAQLRSREPKAIHPRRTASSYLLSGLLKCGLCGASMMGHAAKSGRYQYYLCATAYRNGREACLATPLPK